MDVACWFMRVLPAIFRYFALTRNLVVLQSRPPSALTPPAGFTGLRHVPLATCKKSTSLPRLLKGGSGFSGMCGNLICRGAASNGDRGGACGHAVHPCRKRTIDLTLR